MVYSNFNGRELDLLFSILNQINNSLDVDDLVRTKVFIQSALPIIELFTSLDEEERHEELNNAYRELNFRSYVESSDNPNIADALMKVAEDMANMDSKSLRSIASGGLAKLAESSSVQK